MKTFEPKVRSSPAKNNKKSSGPVALPSVNCKCDLQQGLEGEGYKVGKNKGSFGSIFVLKIEARQESSLHSDICLYSEVH